MWAILSKILVNILISLISDRVLVQGARKMVKKAVKSGVDKVGITDEDAKDLIDNITESTLNTIDEVRVDMID